MWERLEQPLRKGQAAHHAAGKARVPLHKGRHLGAHQLRVLRQEQHRLPAPSVISGNLGQSPRGGGGDLEREAAVAVHVERVGVRARLRRIVEGGRKVLGRSGGAVVGRRWEGSRKALGRARG